MVFPLLLSCASREKREQIRNPQSVNRQIADSPTINNQGGLHLFSATGGSSVIPGLIVLGIALLLAWKGYRMFQKHERKKEAKHGKNVRRILRREGESIASTSSGDSDDNGGDGSQLKPARKNLRVRFYDDDLHSDACLLYTSPSPRD